MAPPSGYSGPADKDSTDKTSSSLRARTTGTYKRNIYRNFLDHAYWYRRLPEGEKREGRAVAYVADWHRIRLITDDQDVLAAVEGLREPGSLTGENESAVIAAFPKEIGFKGVSGSG